MNGGIEDDGEGGSGESKGDEGVIDKGSSDDRSSGKGSTGDGASRGMNGPSDVGKFAVAVVVISVGADG